MKKVALTMAMASALMPYGLADSLYGQDKPASNKALRPCLNCGDQHGHNNSYCSPECCKEHREAKSA